MLNITKSDFDVWKNDSVTIAFYTAIQERIEDAKELLAQQAGIDPANDNYFRGFIRAYQEALQFKVLDLEETSE